MHFAFYNFHFSLFINHFIFSLALILVIKVALASADTIYLEREAKGKGEYVGVAGDLKPETIEAIIRMLKVKKNYHPPGNFGFRHGDNSSYFKKIKLFSNERYNDFKYRLPVEVKDTSGYGVEEYCIAVALEDYISLDSLMNKKIHYLDKWEGCIKVADEEEAEVRSRFDKKGISVSFPVTIEKDSSKIYYLYFGKEGVEEKELRAEDSEPVNIPSDISQDEETINIAQDDKFGFSWWIKKIKEDPFGVSSWELKSISPEGDISPPEENHFYRVDLILNKKQREVDTFDWLVFKDDLSIPIFEDSYLEYDLRAEKTFPGLAVGIFCRLHTSLRNVFSRKLFDHVIFETGEKDEKGVVGRLSNELNPHIERNWYHRRIPLSQYAGRNIDHLYFKVKGTLENPQNAPDNLTYYFDNVRITRGNKPEIMVKEMELNRGWISQ